MTPEYYVIKYVEIILGALLFAFWYYKTYFDKRNKQDHAEAKDSSKEVSDKVNSDSTRLAVMEALIKERKASNDEKINKISEGVLDLKQEIHIYIQNQQENTANISSHIQDMAKIQAENQQRSIRNEKDICLIKEKQMKNVS